MFQKLINHIFLFSLDHAKKVLYFYTFLLFICICVLISGLNIKTSNLDLLPDSSLAVKNFERLASKYGTPNAIIVIVESKSRALRLKISAKLKKDLEFFEKIEGVIYKSFLPDKILEDYELDKYFEAKNYNVLMVQPKDSRSSIKELVPLINKIENKISQYQSSKAQLYLAGLPIFARDDHDIMLNELPLMCLISLLLISFFMLKVLKNYGFLLLGLCTLIVSSVLSLSFTALIPGHLNLLSSAFLAISFGLNVDYLIHFVYSFEEDTDVLDRQNLKKSFLNVLPSMSSSCLSTAIVFFIIAFAEFKGFAELGLTAGCSLIIGLIVYFSFFPALILSFPKKILNPCAKNISFSFLSNKYFSGFIILIAIFLCFFSKFRFDGNYLNLQPKNSKTVYWEKELSKEVIYASNTYLIEVKGAEKAFELSEKIRELKEVAKVQNIVELESLLEEEKLSHLLTKDFRKKFKDQNDNYLLYIIPSIDIWSDESAKLLNKKLRKFQKQVTGLPILAELVSTLSVKSLYQSFYFSILALLLLLYFRFKSLKVSLIAILPSILTSFSLLGVLYLLDLKLNSISMVAFPLILGLALDDGIYLCNSILDKKKNLKRTYSAIIFTSLTTILSFGCLIFTHQRGVSSFGLNIAIGVFLAMFYSLSIIPLFKLSKK
ncbi:MAG: hypothetical protein COB02_11570 [Candidatus Cloacimonadota bacterium]|nr:MAG: hypothetical protein COB02_11570 [Candidatus Cloacimonadota bacterium]